MIHALLRGSDEMLLVFAERAEDDQIGPYQQLAPALLDSDQVVWLAEEPAGLRMFVVSPEFIRALVDGRPDAAKEHLRASLRDCDEHMAKLVAARKDLVQGWRCRVCRADRGFYQIGVAFREARAANGASLRVNLSFCNDSEACTAAAAAWVDGQPLPGGGATIEDAFDGLRTELEG